MNALAATWPRSPEQTARYLELGGRNDSFAAGPSTTQYGSYTLPGGKNYKEILIQAPEKLKQGEYGTEVIDKTQTFRSSHWDQPNVVAHLRLNERELGGKKVTFMEELQSDWAREGRNKGFIGDKEKRLISLAFPSMEKNPTYSSTLKRRRCKGLVILKETSPTKHCPLRKWTGCLMWA